MLFSIMFALQANDVGFANDVAVLMMRGFATFGANIASLATVGSNIIVAYSSIIASAILFSGTGIAVIFYLPL